MTINAINHEVCPVIRMHPRTADRVTSSDVGAYFSRRRQLAGMSSEDILDLEDVDVDPADYDALADADVRLRVNEHGLHIADDLETQVSSQGQDPADAIANLARAVDSYLEATDDDPGDDWL